MVLRPVTMSNAQLATTFQGLIHTQPQPQSNSKPSTNHQILPVPDPVLSYWLTQPSPLSNLHSTPDLPSQCDIAIIGSGMSGVLTLYHILRTCPANNLPSILLLDARSLCSGATARNGGHAKVKTATLSGLKTADERNAFQAYVYGVMSNLKEVVDAEDLTSDCEFEIRRSFDVFLDEEELDDVKSVYEADKKNGEEWCKSREFVPREMVRQVTSIQHAVGAFSCPAMSLWPYKFVTGVLGHLLGRYEADVVNVQMDTPVTNVSWQNGRNVLKTPRGDVQATKVIFATNAYTAGLVPEFEHTITPVKGMASHHVPEKPVHPHLNNTYNIHFGPGTDYLNPRPDGGIVVGGGNWFYSHKTELWKGNFDDSTRMPASAEVHWHQYMQQTFLGWEDSKAKAHMVWTGIQGYTTDGLPHVGRVPSASEEEANEQEKQQWMLAGFNGGGMSFIATAAKAVAKMVLHDLGFEDVKKEFGLLEGMKTGHKRLGKGEGDLGPRS